MTRAARKRSDPISAPSGIGRVHAQPDARAYPSPPPSDPRDALPAQYPPKSTFPTLAANTLPQLPVNPNLAPGVQI
jgi:hypothetical protein